MYKLDQHYKVTDPDGKPVTDKVFVLRPESDQAARNALYKYAQFVEDTQPWLAEEILAYLGDLITAK